MVKKAPQAFRTITEVSSWLDEPAHVLRFWESKFSQIKPVKRAGGRRYYRPEDMELLGGIKTLLHDQGLTIKAVQEMIKSEGVKHIQSFSPELSFDSGRKSKRKKKQAKTEKSSAQKTSHASANMAKEAQQQDMVAQRNAQEAAPASTNEAAGERPKTSHEAVDAAKSKIAAAVGKEREQKKRTTWALNVTRQSSDLTSDEYSDLEELFYQLKMVRNRMNRSLKAL